jgi:hypothetical protein
MPQEPETFPMVMVIVLLAFAIGFIFHRISMIFPEFRKRILAMQADCESRLGDAETALTRLRERMTKLAERIDQLDLTNVREAIQRADKYIADARATLRGIWGNVEPEDALDASSAEDFHELRRTIFLDVEQQAIVSAKNAQAACKNGGDLCLLLEKKLADVDSDLAYELELRSGAEGSLAEAHGNGVLCPEAEADMAFAAALRRQAGAMIKAGFIGSLEGAMRLIRKAGALAARAKRSVGDAADRAAGLREGYSLLCVYLDAAEAEISGGFEGQTSLMAGFAPASWATVKGNVAKARECRLGASRLKSQASRELDAWQWEQAVVTLGRAIALIGRMKFLLDSVRKRLHYLSSLKRGLKEAADDADTDIRLAMEYLYHASQEHPRIDEPKLSGLVREARALAVIALADYPKAYARLHEALSEVRDVWYPGSLAFSGPLPIFDGLGVAGAGGLVRDAKASSEALHRYVIVHDELPEQALTADVAALHLIELAGSKSGKEAIALYAKALDTARSGLDLALAADAPFSEPIVSRPKPFEPVVMVV